MSGSSMVVQWAKGKTDRREGGFGDRGGFRGGDRGGRGGFRGGFGDRGGRFGGGDRGGRGGGRMGGGSSTCYQCGESGHHRAEADVGVGLGHAAQRRERSLCS